MCYAKPGPRCSGHCREDLAKARDAYRAIATKKVDIADPQQLTRLHKAKERLAAAKSRYDRTPEGKRSLHEEADTVEAGQVDRKQPGVDERLAYSAALRAYADHGIEARKVQMRGLRAHEWNQKQIEERLGGEVLRAEREYDAAVADVARTDTDPAARTRLQEASDALVHAQEQWYTTAEGQRDIKGLIKSLVAEARDCKVTRQRDRIMREARELKSVQREAWHVRQRQKAEYNAQKDRDRLLNSEMSADRSKTVTPAATAVRAAAAKKAVPAQRAVEPAAPARAGTGSAWGGGDAQTITVLSRDRKGVTLFPDAQ